MVGHTDVVDAVGLFLLPFVALLLVFSAGVDIARKVKRRKENRIRLS